ncbi:hypothetical protein [Enterococcus sp. AZ072]|uniref:hypothetical protein n=1 Tax=unclassified Enterococcus TaxID=2608891 RepID=UPI003D27C626
MINLYVGSISRILSSSLILSALVFILYTLGQKEVQWSRTFAVLFVLGLLMSIMSGTRDGIGTVGGFPTQGKLFVVLCGLGILSFVVGIAALLSNFFDTTFVFKYGSYLLMVVIVMKTFLVEGHRLMQYFS